ncbi:MAG TPA: hypothetical protein DEP35_09985 [Deltaproteobacteria bacterium]|nr:hypothetical protein [Deltaproteobacteria bacterium]
MSKVPSALRGVPQEKGRIMQSRIQQRGIGRSKGIVIWLAAALLTSICLSGPSFADGYYGRHWHGHRYYWHGRWYYGYPPRSYYPPPPVVYYPPPVVYGPPPPPVVYAPPPPGITVVVPLPR